MRAVAAAALMAWGVAGPAWAVPTPLGPLVPIQLPAVTNVFPGLDAQLVWLPDIRTALNDASAEYRSVIVFFEAPFCGHCQRMKRDVFSRPEVANLLRNFTLAAVDVEEQRDTAADYRIQATPVLLFLAADGRERGRLVGYVPGEQLVDMLREVLNPNMAAVTDEALEERLERLDAGTLSAADWVDVMSALGDKTQRDALRGHILDLTPFPRATFVTLLSDDALAARLGALDILEELTGETHGFDPWLDPESGPRNDDALLAWNQWAAVSTGAVRVAYAALTREEIDGYIRDLIGDNHERSVRAMRMIEEGGAAAVAMLERFAGDHPDLPAGVLRRIVEVRYGIMLPSIGGMDSSLLAHRLVFGNLDVRLQAIRELPRVRGAAVPILSELLRDPDAIVRETAAESLIGAAGRNAVQLLEAHSEQETDTDVLYAILRGLGAVRTKRTLSLLARYADSEHEDLATAAIGSLGALRSRAVQGELQRALHDPRWRVRVAALEAAAKLELGELRKDVEECLSDEDAFVRFTAVSALAKLAGKDAIPQLEARFLENDALKGPIVAAIGSLDAPLPDTFGPALKDKDASVLLTVIDALDECDEHGLPLAAEFSRHADDDVACAALRLLASGSLQKRQYQDVLATVLREGNRRRALTILQVADLSRDSEYARYSSGAMWDPDVLMDIEVTLDDYSGGEPGNGSALDELFAAFAEPKAEPADTRPPAATAPRLDDLFSAFEAVTPTGAGPAETDAPEANQTADTPGGREGLIDAVVPYTERTEDPEMRFTAALFLLGAGRTEGVEILHAGLAEHTAVERLSIAQRMNASRPDVLPLLRTLLVDASSSVRREAAERAAVGGGDALAALLAETERPGTPLAPYEAYSDSLRRAGAEGGGKPAIREWAPRVLSSASNTTLRVLALMLMESAWRPTFIAAIEPCLADPDPWIRRAAWHAMACNDRRALEARLDALLADPAEDVRIIPAHVYRTGGDSWLHTFDAEHKEREYKWTSSSDSRSSRLSAKATAALKQLTEDISAKVRLESFFTLLAHRVGDLDLRALLRTAESFPDQRSIGERIGEYVKDNYARLGDSFAVLVPYVEYVGIDEDTRSAIYAHFKIDESLGAAPTRERLERRDAPLMADYAADASAEAGEKPAAQVEPRALHVVFFRQSGCEDCERVERLLNQLREALPHLRVEAYDIRKVEAQRLNEALCEQFAVPETVRLVAPSIFAAAGSLVRTDITAPRLGELLARSLERPATNWYAPPPPRLAAAQTSIVKRYTGLTLGVIIAAGLFDGINPCAFATIIFFLSYLQVARRRPVEILQIGAAFVFGVFLAYFGLGLGLVEVVSELMILRRVGQLLNLAMALFAFGIMVVSVRDGMLCLQGRLADIALQLPALLKQRIHGTIRHGSRWRHFVFAAFLVGVAISVLELACTGQVYAPTILFMLKSGEHTLGATSYLFVYNAAFVLPLVIIFLLAYGGMRSETLVGVLQRHAAGVKFATAALFLVMGVFLLVGDRLWIVITGG